MIGAPLGSPRSAPVLQWLIETWDRVIASDPGLVRLHQAGSATIGVASTLGVEYGLARFMHAGPVDSIVFMLFGAVVAMMGTMALSGSGVLIKVRTAIFFPVAVGIGLTLGALVHGKTDLMLAVFVVVMFVAVFVRRFGISFFFYGFMGWMGYFFSSFMAATFSSLPGLFAAIIAATVWVTILSVTLLRTNTARSLQQTTRAFDARCRAMARACVNLLNTADCVAQSRMRRKLRTRQIQLSEAALMIEAWSAEPNALPEPSRAVILRRKVVDAQQVLNRLAGSAEILAQEQSEFLAGVSAAAEHLAHRDDAAAIHQAHLLLDEAQYARWEENRQPIVEIFAHAVIEFAELALEALFRRSSQTSDRQPEGIRTINEFEPIVSLFLGNLPGSPAVVRDVPAQGVRWNPLARLDLTTRQAIQVAVAGGLAIIAGRELSPVRYYWAVIAAFIMFTGTGTRTESFLKGLNRVIGTLFGLMASIWVAEMTAGHTWWVLSVVIAAIFCGFYLIRLSYAYMIFFITIMIGQLYSILHEFSAGLLVLRLEETAIGAAIGFIVALLVVPVSTRATVRAVRTSLLTDLATLLRTAAKILNNQPSSHSPAEDSEPVIDVDAASLSLDNRMRQLALVATPLTRPFIWGYSPRVRHRIVLYATVTATARAIAVALREPPEQAQPALGEACRALARLAEGHASMHVDIDSGDLREIENLHALPDSRWDATDIIRRRIIHMEELLRQLGTTHSDPL